MAQATTKRFGDFTVVLESTTTPGTYVAPCGFTSRAFSLDKDLNDVNIPDCADESAASWLGRDTVAKSAEISGEGVLATESYERWRQAWLSDEPVNARVEIAGEGAWSGAFVVRTLEHGGERGGRMTLAVTMPSDGPVIWTDEA